MSRCLLVPLVLGLGSRGVRADEHRFETDYILCPAHLRVQGPQELRAARGLKAGELRVSWAVPPHLTAVGGGPLDQAALTVIADDGTSPVVQQRPPADTAATLPATSRPDPAGEQPRLPPAGEDLRLRKRVEEIFGWMKTVDNLQRIHYRCGLAAATHSSSTPDS